MAIQSDAFVLPCGIEPQPSEPESEILSIKLREHCIAKLIKKYNIFTRTFSKIP